MNLTRQPVTQKPRRGGKDPARLAAVAALPCVICVMFDMRQNSRTEVHHCKSGRYGSLKEADRNTIPLCHSHHNKLIPHDGDADKIGFHNRQETWEGAYGRDYDYLPTVDQWIDKATEADILGDAF